LVPLIGTEFVPLVGELKTLPFFPILEVDDELLIWDDDGVGLTYDTGVKDDCGFLSTIGEKAD
jgi:hypothetical protein